MSIQTTLFEFREISAASIEILNVSITAHHHESLTSHAESA